MNAFALVLSLAAAASTPAEQRIAWAEKVVAQRPQQAQGYNQLAMALARRARETSDPAWYERARRALEKSFVLEPDNFEGRKVEAWVLLGRHDFAAALEVARALQRRAPDDVLVYGLLTDACVELGRYDEAEKATQWMLDLRPGNLPGLTRAAYLRELFGDIDGAVEMMGEAFDTTPPNEAEDRAWILTQMAHLHLSRGEIAPAERLLARAFELFPGYHYALAQMAKVRAAQGKPEEAVELLRQRFQAAPHPENLYDLARALARAGHTDEARKGFEEFERKARAESQGPDNANRELIFYYAEEGARPPEALRIAEREVARRQDMHTLHAQAWALHANGREGEAREGMDKALSVGLRDAIMLYHAGVISAAAGDRAAARRYLRESLALDPASEVSPEARRQLATLDAAPEPAHGTR